MSSLTGRSFPAREKVGNASNSLPHCHHGVCASAAGWTCANAITPTTRDVRDSCMGCTIGSEADMRPKGSGLDSAVRDQRKDYKQRKAID
jgi:hypothetical protein